MKSFEVPSRSAAEFVDAMRARLAEKEYGRYVSIDLRGDDLIVELRWMGTTSFRFRVEPGDEGFRAVFVSQQVSPFHSVFADRFEEYFDKALAKAGGTSV